MQDPRPDDEAGLFRRAAADIDASRGPVTDADLDGMLAAVRRELPRSEQGLGGFLRARPTWQRRLLVTLALALPALAAMAVARPPDEARPYLAISGAALATASVACAFLATRPLQRPALRAGLDWVVFGGALAGLLGVVLWGHVSVAGAPAHGILACSSVGVMAALPALAAGRLVDRGAFPAPLLMATAAGLAANLALLLWCPVRHASHCVPAHVGVALWIVALVLVARHRGRARRPG